VPSDVANLLRDHRLDPADPAVAHAVMIDLGVTKAAVISIPLRQDYSSPHANLHSEARTDLGDAWASPRQRYRPSLLILPSSSILRPPSSQSPLDVRGIETIKMKLCVISMPPAVRSRSQYCSALLINDQFSTG
jgi:hypothetical protein